MPFRFALLAMLALPVFATDSIPPGSLTTPKGICPLRHTDVQVRIAGPLARVTVTQEFNNPFAEKIEAVYTFPLPPDSAVDDMTMHVGDRTIRGLIKPRDEARKIYDDARRTGRIASLLDQERPNIFTQAVANIVPGATVKIEIAYVETVPYEAGAYSFNFPMVVAPRYMPRHGVPDAGRIAPPVTPEGTRAGHDISVEVHLDAGVPVESLESRTHDVVIERPNPRQAVVKLRDKAVIPNKDFILKYGVAGHRVEDAVLTHTGYFTLLLQPPDRVQPEEIAPKELVFVLDTSGSMSGFPIEKAKETMRLALDGLNPVQDRVPVDPADRLEELGRGRVRVQGLAQVFGHRGGCLAGVRAVPPAVGPGPLHLVQTGRLHPAGLDERGGFVGVDLRPLAAGLARGEALQPVVFVQRALLPVDPAEAERFFEGLGVGDGRLRRALLRGLEPDAGRGRPVPGQPFVPVGRRPERQHRKVTKVHVAQ